MQKLSDVQKAFLREATNTYASQLPGSPAAEFLASRGLTIPEVLDRFRLGFVGEPLPGHDMYRGMLAIPYLRPSFDSEEFVCSIRFRCLEDHEHFGHGKYNTLPGDRPRMYNTEALVRASDRIAICEGEIDAITTELCGIPAVGIPGIQLWKRDFRAPFLGYEAVFVLSDGDDAGRQLATTIAKDLPNVKQIPMPPGMDVNSVFMTNGPDAITERIR